MVEEVIWLENAKKCFNSIISYLKSEWSLNTANEFHRKTFELLELIAVFPNLGFPSDKNKDLRMILVTRHNYIIYRIYKNKLFVVDIIDTRKDVMS